MTHKVKILYFASLGERLGLEEEWFEPGSQVKTVADIRRSLSQRGEAWSAQLADPSLRTAVDQTIANDDTSIVEAIEIAFFPPVTGG